MNTSQRERSLDPNNSNWMISFGDLLTLLVCFFLAIMSERWRSNIVATETTQSVSKIVEKNQTLGSVTSPTGSGTSLAEVTTATLISELVLFRNDIVADVSEPSAAGLQRLREWERENRAESGTIMIEACSQGESDATWSEGQRLALGIRRVIESEGETTVSQLRSAGSECEGLESWTPTTSTAVAVVKLIKNEKDNG